MPKDLYERFRIKFPDYHKLPLHLSLEEIKDAEETIMAIFNMYGLDSFRINLMAIRNTALKAADRDEAEASPWAIVYTCEQTIKLVEAIYALYAKQIEEDEEEEYEPPAS